MAQMKDMFSGDLLIYNLFIYSLLPCMFLFSFLPPFTAMTIIVAYGASFIAWMTSRQLRKRKGKEGMSHFDARLFRSEDYHEELILSFKKKKTIDFSRIDLTNQDLQIENEIMYKNAVMFELQEESEELTDYDEFLKNRKELAKLKAQAAKKASQEKLKKAEKGKTNDKTGKKASQKKSEPKTKKLSEPPVIKSKDEKSRGKKK